MPLLEEEGFSRLLKSDMQQHIFFIFGDDAYLKEFYCDRLVAKTVEDAMKVFNFHVYQDDEIDLEDVFSDADNLPVMAEKTCLLVKNYPLHELKKEQLSLLEKQLDGIPDTSVMIFLFSSLSVDYNAGKQGKWNAVVSLFSKKGVAVRLDHRSTAKIAAMLVRKAKDRNAEIEPAEAQYFVECVGEDMQTLLNDFNKLCSFSCGEKITREMIDVTTIKSIEAKVFDISAAIFSGNTDKAFAVGNELIRQKTELPSILGAMITSYVDIYRYKVALNAGKGYSEIASAFGYKGNYSFRFKKIEAFSRKIGIGAIRRAIDILSEADVRSKSTRVDNAILLTETIAKLASCIPSDANGNLNRR